ncbi:hypothetical protein [Clostridium sp. KNHs214]|nr:hypothetical protein [Clostridium sp. KNHs214]
MHSQGKKAKRKSNHQAAKPEVIEDKEFQKNPKKGAIEGKS